MTQRTMTATWLDANGNRQTRTGLTEAEAQSLQQTAAAWEASGAARNLTLAWED